MFSINWVPTATTTYNELKLAAQKSFENRLKNKKTKPSKQEGLFKQIYKAIELLKTNPRHPALKTHEFGSEEHPWDKNAKVFEAYAQNNTPGAYRIFWCYGPEKNQITIIAITSHP